MPQRVTEPWARWTAITDEPLVRAAIERSDEAWLSAGAIAEETGLPPDRVQTVLDSAPAWIIGDLGIWSGPQQRYSTREHYRATTGLLRRYFDAVLSS